MLLPSWWHAMKPKEKRNDFDVIKENGGFTMECLIEHRKKCKIPAKDMQNMQVCLKPENQAVLRGVTGAKL
jgi:hypothetical protein